MFMTAILKQTYSIHLYEQKSVMWLHWLLQHAYSQQILERITEQTKKLHADAYTE